MFRQIIQQISSKSHLRLIHNVPSVWTLRSISSANKRLDEDISDEVVNISRQIIGRTKKQDEEIDANSEKFYGTDRTCHNLKTNLQCTDEEAQEIVLKNRKLMMIRNKEFSARIQYLFQNNITIKSIRENPWLLLMDQGKLPLSLTKLSIDSFTSRISAQKNCSSGAA
jgi:hypothetical protein